jgi:hypothetical protein
VPPGGSWRAECRAGDGPAWIYPIPVVRRGANYDTNSCLIITTIMGFPHHIKITSSSIGSRGLFSFTFTLLITQFTIDLQNVNKFRKIRLNIKSLRRKIAGQFNLYYNRKEFYVVGFISKPPLLL